MSTAGQHSACLFECNCSAAQQGFVAVALRSEHYFSLNLAFLRELLRSGRLVELESPNDGDTEIAWLASITSSVRQF